MAQESSVVVGSGLNPAKYGLPFNERSRERHLRGNDVVVVNPEDASAGLSGLASRVLLSGGAAQQLPNSPLMYRRAISVRNNSAATLYVGFTSAVSTATGYPLSSGQSLPLQVNGAVKVWGIADSPVDVRIIELA